MNQFIIKGRGNHGRKRGRKRQEKKKNTEGGGPKREKHLKEVLRKRESPREKVPRKEKAK